MYRLNRGSPSSSCLRYPLGWMSSRATAFLALVFKFEDTSETVFLRLEVMLVSSCVYMRQMLSQDGVYDGSDRCDLVA